MNLLDWLIIIIYITGLIALGRHLGKGQVSTEDYYLGSRSLSWWTVGISTMATQLGAISFVSAPAFVALKPNGGLIWLGYEFAVPAAVLFLMIFFMPVLHAAKIVSVYEYLEKRFDTQTRSLISFIFQISRALATGVSIYAIGIVLSAVLKIPIAATIILVGIVTIIYDTFGGMKAVVYSDVIQMVILLFGIIICGAAAYNLAGGWDAALSTITPERLKIVDMETHGFGDGNDFSFFALVIGGFFLYASYYGCDQSQIQRELSTKSLDDSRKSLMFNGLIRFPVVIAYCVMGLLIGAFASQSAEFMSLIPKDKVDYMVPIFILNYLPNGVIGIVVVGILAAFMSSLDSAINSLSAATMRDVYQKHIKPGARDDSHILWSKVLTVFWGVVCTAFAFIVGGISDTVIEAINKVGSVFYGPMLAAFILAILVKRANSTGAKIGVLSGVLTNLILWVWFPGVSWLWWNATGCLVGIINGYLFSLLRPRQSYEVEVIKKEPTQINWNWRYAFLFLYFLGIMVLSYLVGSIWT